MTKKLVKILQGSQAFQLTWFINNICTNHCDYCNPALHMGSNYSYDWEDAKRFLNHLVEKHKRINCILLGGEPTVSPFLPEFVDIVARSGNNSISMSTNCVRPVSYWKDIAPKFTNITVSYHPMYGIDNVFEKLEEIRKHTRLTVKVMFDSRYWDKALNFYTEVLDRNIAVSAVRILPEIARNNAGSTYTQEQSEWLATNSKRHHAPSPFTKTMQMEGDFYYDDNSVDFNADINHLISSRRSTFKGWECSIGIESLYVGPDGWIKKGNCSQGGKLFHLKDFTNYTFQDSKEICNIDLCSCPTDVIVSKFARKDAV